MYRLKEIQEKLMQVVGWEQPYNPADAIRPALAATESGLYFQSAHPLVTLDNVRAIMPEQFIEQFPEYSATKSYVAGDRVRTSDKKVWQALQATTGITPGAVDSADYWIEYNYLSDYLERETRNGISSVVQTFTTVKQLDQETRNLLERRTFFDGAGRLAATIDNRGKICGYEIMPVRSMGVTTKIERIGLQTTGATGKVRLYLFHSNTVEPMRTIDIEITNTNGGFQWFTVDDLFLPYISDANNSGGAWFLCYNQNDLPEYMEAINIAKDWSREPCSTCNAGDIEAWRQLAKFALVSPFTITAPADFKDAPRMWDIAKNIYTNTVNYGINVEITVGCDLTDFIVSQRHIFANVIQKQVAANVLRKLAMNPDVRVNRNQSNASRMEILYELDGNTSGVRPGGLGYDLQKAYKALSMDTRGLDRICLSCNNRGVNYRTV